RRRAARAARRPRVRGRPRLVLAHLGRPGEPRGALRGSGEHRSRRAGGAARAMRRYAVAHLDNLDSFPVAHGLEWHPIRRRFGIRSFGVNAYTAEKPGDWVVEEHKEGSGHEELYLVVRGRAQFTLDGEERDAPAGTIVFLPDA